MESSGLKSSGEISIQTLWYLPFEKASNRRVWRRNWMRCGGEETVENAYLSGHPVA